jgi:hypothetical protein
MTIEKTEQRWPIECRVEAKQVQSGRWSVTQWDLQALDTHPKQESDWVLPLDLFRDERTDYRFNLSSQQPKLFLAAEEQDDQLTPVSLTASQTIAGNFLDGDY